MKKKFLVLFIYFLLLCAFAKEAAVFNFSKNTDTKASAILKEYIETITLKVCPEAGASYYDIDGDNQKEIIGYAKNGNYYNFKGYALLILKKSDSQDAITINNEKWELLNSDVYFNPEKIVKIKGKTINYEEGDFYNNKKRSAKFYNNKLKTGCDIEGYNAYRARQIEDVTKFSKNSKQHKMHVSEFSASKQKNINLQYKNLDEKAKRLLEMK